MHYRNFLIKNFKGIKEASVRISESNHARVHTLVGLNESGKTTILEAIHSFSPDADTKVIVGSDLSRDEAYSEIVPRYAVSDFTGEISVEAEIAVSSEDKKKIASALYDEYYISIKFSNEDDENINYKKYHSYKNGDYRGKFRSTTMGYQVKEKGQRKFHEATGENRRMFMDILERNFPKIAYFPTFVFDFPDKIYLSGRVSDRKNAFYRRVFQDILDFDNRGHNINDHVVSRVQKTEFNGPWSNFFNLFRSSNEGEKIDQVVDRAAQAVTTTIFKKWNEIFGEDTRGKEVIIPWQTDEGLPFIDKKGVEQPANKHDVYIQFRIKDGVNRYNVEDRSLGFRWFFAFLLFTQFRVARQQGSATIFLFDEPASNLHSAAQQKLIESFPEIAKNPHVLIYSTHSHYMIEPKWLEQAYIVENGSAGGSDSVLESGLIDDRSLNIKATPYRKFVHKFPSKFSYFQPIIDRLDVIPSKFDLKAGGVIVEGKSDYYILRYASERLFKKKITLFPANGAGTMGGLIAMHRGWGLPVRVLLDGDKAGSKEKKRYEKEYSLSAEEIFTISDLLPIVVEVEDLISIEDKKILVGDLSKDKPAVKKIIMQIFQENLVSGGEINLSKETISNFSKIEESLEATLEKPGFLQF